MDDKLKAVLVEYLGRLLTAIEKGASFANDQIPIIIQEKLHFDLIEALIWAGFEFLLPLSVIAAAVWLRGYIKRTDGDGDWKDVRVGVVAATVFATTLLTIPAFWNIMTAVKIYVAPRLYTLEWIRELVK